MHTEPLLDIPNELLLVAGIGVIASVILVRLKIPIISILLLAGYLVGPHVFGFASTESHIESFAEIGVVLLLFTIGLEFSLQKIVRIGKLISIGGGLQVGLTTIVVTLLAMLVGIGLEKGIFLGFAISLSSTAIVLRALSERAEIDAPHGRFIVGTLIFQDLCVVPMILILPILAHQGSQNPFIETGLALGKAAIVVVATIIVARLVVPKLFQQIDRTHSREVFLLAIIAICLGTAWLTSFAGLSLSLGAFLAGIILADTDYAHRAASDVLPLRGIFTSFFFVSIGMLFDPQILLTHPIAVLFVFAFLLFGKALIATISVLAMRFPMQVAIMAGFGLAQFGEFSFVLVKAGQMAGLITREEVGILLNAGIFTMLLTPIVMQISPHFAAGAKRLRRLEHMIGARGIDEPIPVDRELRDHVVIVGYGVGGHVLARALKTNQIPYLIIELDAERVRKARRDREPAYYGDIASQEAIENANVQHARGLVLLINDASAAERAIVFARQFAPTTPIFVRTKYLNDADFLIQLGATDVIVEEVEAALEMLAKVLKLTDMEKVDRFDRLHIARSQLKIHN